MNLQLRKPKMEDIWLALLALLTIIMHAVIRIWP